MRKFGWNYPPGCSGPPEDYLDTFPESEEMYGLLEEVGCPQETIDAACEMVETLVNKATPECSYCGLKGEMMAYGWRPWFAWYPIKCIDDKWRWLSIVYRAEHYMTEWCEKSLHQYMKI